MGVQSRPTIKQGIRGRDSVAAATQGTAAARFGGVDDGDAVLSPSAAVPSAVYLLTNEQHVMA
uniref:Uncharacterized protein n=1 Tax=Setaria viridis TaxID=4556 RepID=A0A4U6TKL8_SETVI|nr:hypothetical protein SEVIR_8G157400v2 [Setaria viridis]